MFRSLLLFASLGFDGVYGVVQLFNSIQKRRMSGIYHHVEITFENEILVSCIVKNQSLLKFFSIAQGSGK